MEWGWAEGRENMEEREKEGRRRRKLQGEGSLLNLQVHHSYPFELCTHLHAHVPACSPLTPGARQGTW